MPSPKRSADVLVPYVPRLVLEWIRECPEIRHRRIDGSLAFVDISGFTKMTERLARKGRVGAEEVTDVLNLCFTHLLATAYDFDGSVLKWGGDAVLLLFTGGGHSARAAASAHRMRGVLRQFGAPDTSAGRIRLRMSVGIHSGELDFFLVGGSHRELLVTGPAASQTVLMEQLATAGEIVISAATAGALPAGCVGAPREDGFLLRREPRPDAQLAPPIESVDAVDLASCVPLELREHLLGGGGDPEHRAATVAFLQFRGVDGLLETSGPAAAAETLDALVRRVLESAEEHSVAFHLSDIDRDGGKLMLAAGVPDAVEDGEERMLRALREILDTPCPLELRAGVNQGPLFSGEFGPPYRRSYSILGDAVNLAARVMGKAEAGQILATDAVLTRSRTIFEREALEPFLVKGKAKPVQASLVGHPMSRAAAVRDELPLIGREAELTELADAVALARDGQGLLVEIVGEPGIGKSRLVTELRRRAEPATVLATSCDPYEVATPYHAVRPILRRVLALPEERTPQDAQHVVSRTRLLAPELEPWLPLVGAAADVDIPDTDETLALELEFKKSRLEWAVVQLVAASLRGPALFAFEDAHWMDDASAALLHILIAEAFDRPWLVCVTRREIDTGFVPVPGTARTIRPAPLTATDAIAMADADPNEAPLPPHLIEALAERSGGNPLFLAELLAASRGDAGAEPDTLPDSVEVLLASQIDQLGASDRTLLRYAAVMGATFDRTLLESAVLGRVGLSTDPGVWRRLGQFTEEVGRGVYRFRHALVRDAAYQGLPYRRRRQLHGLVGDALESAAGADPEAQAEVLSLHFFHAASHGKAWQYACVAGERAQRKFANVEAAALFRRAVESARALPDLEPAAVASVYRSLGDVSERAGMYDDAARAYRAARRLVAGEPVAEAEILLKEGIVRERSGRYTQAMGWYARALKAIEHAEADEAASVRAQLSVWYAAARRQQGRLHQCIEWCRRAIEEAEASGDREALAHAHRLLGWAKAELGAVDAEEHLKAALAIYEELGDLSGLSTVLNNLGIDAYFSGRWDEARELYDRSREARRKTGDEVNAAHGTNNIAEILSDQGHLDDAERLFREALRTWRAARFRLGIAFATANLGRVAARGGRHEEAQRLYDEAIAEFRAIGAEGQALETEARVAENLLLSGQVDVSERLARELVDRAASTGGMAPVRAMLFRILGYALARRDAPAALDAFEEGLRIAREAEAQYEVALTLEAQATLARRADDVTADGLAMEAHAILQRLGVVSTPRVTVPAVLSA